jgi:hypothetical protein
MRYLAQKININLNSVNLTLSNTHDQLYMTFVLVVRDSCSDIDDNVGI